MLKQLFQMHCSVVHYHFYRYFISRNTFSNVFHTASKMIGEDRKKATTGTYNKKSHSIIGTQLDSDIPFLFIPD